MGRRYAYALAAGAVASLLVSYSSLAQGPPSQPGGPAVPVQPGGGAGGIPAQPGGIPNLHGQPGGSSGLSTQPGAPIRSGAPVLDQIRPSTQPVQSAAPLRERWREMSPEQRKRVRANAERWQHLAPEEQKALREQREWRQMRLKREAEEAMRESGLQLEAERRALFERRYIEERRRIDQELRRELREKRQRELAPVVERLKSEITQQGGGTPGKSGGSPSSSPKK